MGREREIRIKMIERDTVRALSLSLCFSFSLCILGLTPEFYSRTQNLYLPSVNCVVCTVANVGRG
jgi:hypothetical protein